MWSPFEVDLKVAKLCGRGEDPFEVAPLWFIQRVH